MAATQASLMVQGTTSDAGKSTLVAGLCRVLARKKASVAPFKPQNMALNSAVTTDGGEIGRAQALQAQACFLAPHTDMNPVLLKPSSDTNAQVIIHGHAIQNMAATVYHDYKTVAHNAVMTSFARLQQQYDYIMIEGAGSPAEINLRQGDIANMGFAEAANCPVILIADIDKGGVFAHLIGTLALLSESEQNRIVGFVINRFRGDIALLQSGLDWLEERTGKPVLGVLPYLKQFYLDAEDAIDQQQVSDGQASMLNVVVPVLPRISNHTDFDPLRLHPNVNLQFVAVEQTPPPCDCLILPGSKNVREDLAVLTRHGWPAIVQKHLRYGGKLLGICGGYQMLGQFIDDPDGVEGPPGRSAGLALIDMHTTLHATKTLVPVQGSLTLLGQSAALSGYEIHNGQSQFAARVQTLVSKDNGDQEGYCDPSGQILGSYCHGLFDSAQAGSLLLQWAGLSAVPGVDLQAQRELQIERLADVLERHFDFAKLNVALRQGGFLPLPDELSAC